MQTAALQLCNCVVGGLAFDLHEIGLGQLEPRIGNPRLQPSVIGQQQQAFAVAVKPPGGIDALDGDEFRKRRALRRRACVGELRQDAEGFVELDQPGHVCAHNAGRALCLAGCIKALRVAAFSGFQP